MFATKKDAENWIAEYGPRKLLTTQKRRGHWKIMQLGVSLGESKIHEIEELHELKARQVPEEK